MAPNKRSANLGASSVVDPQDLCRLLLRFKLASSRAGGSAAVRECRGAAEEFVTCLAKLEAGPTLLQRALAQATHAEAKKLCELAKRLSGEGAAALLSVLSSHALPNDQRWAFQRPLLRLLLWLLPEHIPAAQAQQGTPAPGGRSSNSNSPEPSTAGGLGPTQGGQAAKGKPSKSTTPAGPNEKEWHGSFALTFILGILSANVAGTNVAGVATVGVGMKVIDDTLTEDPWQPGPQGAQTVEECLVWLTLLSRIQKLSAELEGAAQSVEMPDTGQAELRQCVRNAQQLLHRCNVSITAVARPVLYWLVGMIGAPSRGASSEQQAFAESVKPSKELVNSVGLWDKPVAILWRVAVLLSDAPLWNLPNSSDDLAICIQRFAAHQAMSQTLLPADRTVLQGADLAEYEQHLPLLVEMNLRSLTLVYRLAWGCPGSLEMYAHSPRVAFGVYFAIQHMISAALVPASGLMCGAQHYMPDGLPQPTGKPPVLLEFFQQCDAVITTAEQQWQPKQQLMLKAAQELQQMEQRLVRYEACLLRLQHSSQKSQPTRQVNDQEQQQQHIGEPGQYSSRSQQSLEQQQQQQQQQCVSRLREEAQQQVLKLEHDWKQLFLQLDEVQQVPQPAEQQPGTSLHDLGPWVRAALAGANALYLVSESLEVFGPQWGLRELSLIVYKPAFHLMQWFRPTSTTLDTIETQGWAMCLAAASGGLHVLTDWQTEEGASGSSTPQDRATCLRILIDHMLPVLRSVSHPYDSSVIANNGSAVPADAALLMLMASARILHTCVALAASGQCAESILPQGVQPASSRTTESICSEGAAAAAGQPQGGDELLVILDSVLSMAYDLISGGPWWEQARAKHQLLLLHTLYNTSVAVAGTLGYYVKRRRSSDVFWRMLASWSKPPLGQQNAAQSYNGPTVGAAGSRDAARSRASGPAPGYGGAGAADSEAHGQHSRAPIVCFGRVNITGLVLELTGCQWRLLSDPAIVGEAGRPAAWMSPTNAVAARTCGVHLEMLRCIDAAVGSSIEQQAALARAAVSGAGAANSSSTAADNNNNNNNNNNNSPPDSRSLVYSDALTTGRASDATLEQPSSATGQQRHVSTDDAVQMALQLAALSPDVSWDGLLRALRPSLWQYDGDLTLHMKNLFSFMQVRPYLRVVAMLAIAGRLTECQKQVVVALLGGVPEISAAVTVSNCSAGGTSTSGTAAAITLPIPEPASIAAARERGGFTRQEIAMAFLSCFWVPRDSSSTGQQSECRAQLRSVPDHLLLAFGAAQLPWMALMQEVNRAHATDTPAEASRCTEMQEFKERVLKAVDALKGVSREYAQWMNASLMAIIKEVLSQA